MTTDYLELSRNTSERRELIRRSNTGSLCELCEHGGLADRREANQSHTSISRLHHIKTLTLEYHTGKRTSLERGYRQKKKKKKKKKKKQKEDRGEEETFPPDLDGSSSCCLNFASLAFKSPKWYSVAIHRTITI